MRCISIYKASCLPGIPTASVTTSPALKVPTSCSERTQSPDRHGSW